MENQTTTTETVKVNGVVPPNMTEAFEKAKADIEATKAKASAAEEALKAEIARLRGENEKLKTAKASAGKLSLKVSDKGALSVYGMGRFPVTLYREQWERLFAHQDEIKGFIKANAAGLSVKGE